MDAQIVLADDEEGKFQQKTHDCQVSFILSLLRHQYLLRKGLLCIWKIYDIQHVWRKSVKKTVCGKIRDPVKKR
jgi:hypothetical protein